MAQQTNNNPPVQPTNSNPYNFYRLVILGVVALLIVVGGIYFFVFSNRTPAQPEPEPEQERQISTNQFSGTIQRVEGNSIFVLGGYVVRDNPELLSNESLIEVEVLVDGSTEFVRQSVYLPSAEDVAETDGYYNASDLRREETPGSLSDLSDDPELGLEITATGNIFEQKRFTASKIIYVEPILP